jgi:hypothetical protein
VLVLSTHLNEIIGFSRFRRDASIKLTHLTKTVKSAA